MGLRPINKHDHNWNFVIINVQINFKITQRLGMSKIFSKIEMTASSESDLCLHDFRGAYFCLRDLILLFEKLLYTLWNIEILESFVKKKRRNI